MANVGTICKRACPLAVAAILFVCALFGGCKNNEPALPSDVKEAFLTVYFTSNYEGRYDDLLERLENTKENFDKTLAVFQKYYTSFNEYVSEDVLNTMMANRDNIKYEKLAREKGIACVPAGFEFEEYSKSGDETTYSFVAHLTLTDADGAGTKRHDERTDHRSAGRGRGRNFQLLYFSNRLHRVRSAANVVIDSPECSGVSSISVGRMIPAPAENEDPRFSRRPSLFS